MPGTSDPYAAFRLNFEQQRKRAKDLLRAVRAGDAAARRRLADAVALPVPDAVTIKLADAQFAIAHELGLPVKLIGVGEGLDDLRPFDAADFAAALVGA